MPLTVTSKIQINVNVAETLTVGLATGSTNGGVNYDQSFSNGTGANKIQNAYTRTLSFSASTPQTLTLSNLTDDSGRTIAFTKIKELVIYVQGATAMTLGGAVSNPWLGILVDASDMMTIRPGMAVFVDPGATGYAVASGSSDQLKFDPGASTNTVVLVITGE